ncbi:hypothetical protein C8Q75DRAFT_811800 [Abortiporus biennis]|nr:hypothetical protein C8Q75DRAFT_811800 [Abortiporus biennis]
MSRNGRYYQVGGFESHTRDLPSNIARRLCHPTTGADLILGVQPNGASYLLLPEDEFLGYFRRAYASPLQSSRYLSLSPVHFDTVEGLEDKLDQLTSKKNKERRDRSKTNRSYTTYPADTLTQEGKARAAFEYQRLFLRLCRRELPRVERFGLKPIRWNSSDIRVVSIALNLWSADRRSLVERHKDPKILDVSWTEFTLPTSPNFDLVPNTTTYYIVSENTRLRNPGRDRLNFNHGETKELPQESIAVEIQKIFTSSTNEIPSRSGSSTLVLLYNESITLRALGVLGVDTDKWYEGLVPLLEPLSELSVGMRHSSDRNPQSVRGRERDTQMRVPYDSHVRTRRRSMSPRRDSIDPRRRNRSPVLQGSSSVVPNTEDCQILYVDVKKLLATLKRAQAPSDTIIGDAFEFQLRDACKNGLPEKGWCAGNESRILGAIWSAMAAGNAIDEQRVSRWPKSAQDNDAATEDANQNDNAPASSGYAELGGQEENDSDSDVDPNDIFPAGGTMASVQVHTGNTVQGVEASKDPYEALEDDDDW